MATSVRVRATREGVRRLLRTLPAALSGRGPDPTGLARSVSLRLGVTALAMVKQAFAEKAAGGTDESGLRWVPLSPLTVASRRQGKGTGTVQILRDTGVLMNSLSPGGVDNVLDARPGLASVGTSCPYARWQHEGTATTPARPLWPDPKDWPARWKALLAQQLAEGAVQAAAELVRRAV